MEPQDVPDANANILYVGNLDKRVTEQMMLNILRTGLQHIKDKILSANMFHGDMTTPEGYCFVKFGDNNSACQAMTFLNGRDFCGKKVKVNWATNSGGSGGIPKVLETSVSIYVGNLDDTIDESDLKQAFEVFGDLLNVKVVRDPVTNKSKNIGFISFSNKPDAEKAIRDMHGAMLKTRPIKTNWATRNTSQKREELDYDEVYRETDSSNCTVYVGGIPANCQESQLRNFFESYGTITDVRIFPAKNYAFIRFDSHASAATAICKTSGTDLLGSTLKCWWGKDSPDVGNRTNNHSNNYNNSHQNYNNDNSQQNMQQRMQNMTPQQQQQQYMQQYMYNPYYQQQYYQYWMQQYQYQQQMMQQQQNGGGGAYSQQQTQPGGATPQSTQQQPTTTDQQQPAAVAPQQFNTAPPQNFHQQQQS